MIGKDKTAGRPPVFISAPLSALVEGIYRADTTIGLLRRKGNLGIGTFNDLDGELVLLDDAVYCLRPQGSAERMADDVRTPFALCTHFEGDTEERFQAPIAAEAFEHAVLDLIPSPNLMYAIRIDGHFSHVQARSVPKQSNYLPLVEVTRVQTVFDFRDVEGTIIGFYTPQFLNGVHLPGLHLHFITADRTAGGHLLRASSTDITLKLQHSPTVELGLPMTVDFLTMESTRDVDADLNEAER